MSSWVENEGNWCVWIYIVEATNDENEDLMEIVRVRHKYPIIIAWHYDFCCFLIH
jgi:hypothetical protein